MVVHKYSVYYASIMLNAFRHLLCSSLCQYNRRVLIYGGLYSTYICSKIKSMLHSTWHVEATNGMYMNSKTARRIILQLDEKEPSTHIYNSMSLEDHNVVFQKHINLDFSPFIKLF